MQEGDGEMKEQFEVGDKVRAFGVDGVVVVVMNAKYGIVVSFENTSDEKRFTHDGVYLSWHKEPSLFLVEKAKKEEPIVQWYSVLAKPKSQERPRRYSSVYKGEDDFLNTIGLANDNFDWIKLTPVCKTQGNKLVEE